MNKVSNLLNNNDLMKRIGVLMLCLGIFKLGMHVYVPGIDREVLKAMTQNTGLFSLMNTFTGGALSTFSIFAVGIMPYITASIIVQLLQMDVVPKLTEWSKQGEAGKKKLKRLTYALTLILALMQSAGISVGFNTMYAGLVVNPNVMSYSVIAIVLTLGTVILVVLGEIIERKGIGKGISMIILAGIMMTLPNNLAMYFDMEFTNAGSSFLAILKSVMLLSFVYILLLTVIIVNGGTRKVPIQSANTGQFGKVSAYKSFLPIKINAAGVIPVIFASSFFMLPATIAGLLGEGKVTGFINSYLSYKSTTGIIVYALLIVLFNYFYTFVQMDPEKIAENLRSNNNFVPTIRPGKETERYFSALLMRLTVVSSAFLALVAVLPMILGKIIVLPEQLVLSGTSLIIIVSVIVDLKSQIQAQVVENHYHLFRKNNSPGLWKRVG